MTRTNLNNQGIKEVKKDEGWWAKDIHPSRIYHIDQDNRIVHKGDSIVAPGGAN